jgi:hypothetical protein
MSSFHVDSRINIKLEYELAIRVGELILRAGTDDKQILALGHKLANMDEEERPEFEQKWQEKPFRKHSHFSGWAKDEWKETPPVHERAPEKTTQEAPVATMREKVRSRKIRWGIE